MMKRRRSQTEKRGSQTEVDKEVRKKLADEKKSNKKYKVKEKGRTRRGRS